MNGTYNNHNCLLPAEADSLHIKILSEPDKTMKETCFYLKCKIYALVSILNEIFMIGYDIHVERITRSDTSRG